MPPAPDRGPELLFPPSSRSHAELPRRATNRGRGGRQLVKGDAIDPRGPSHPADPGLVPISPGRQRKWVDRKPCPDSQAGSLPVEGTPLLPILRRHVRVSGLFFVETRSGLRPFRPTAHLGLPDLFLARSPPRASESFSDLVSKVILPALL